MDRQTERQTVRQLRQTERASGGIRWAANDHNEVSQVALHTRRWWDWDGNEMRMTTNGKQKWSEQLSWVELATMTMTMMMRRVAADIANCGNYLCVSCGNSEWKWPTNCQVKWSNIAESWAEAAKVSARCVCTSMYRREEDRQNSVVLGSENE